MKMLVSLFFGLFLVGSTEVYAGDLALAGALSGMGQGLNQAFQSMQAAMIQQHLMEEQVRLQQERERQAYERQADREKMAYDRAGPRHFQGVTDNWRLAEYQELVAEKRRLDDQRTKLAGEPSTEQRQRQIEAHNRQSEAFSIRAADFDRSNKADLGSQFSTEEEQARTIKDERLKKWREADTQP